MFLPPRALRAGLLAAAAVLSMGLTACSDDDSTTDGTTTTAATNTAAASATSTTAPNDAGAPSAETLRHVLDSLADPDKSADEKTQLIVDGEQRKALIEQMNKLLAGYGTLTFEVTGVTAEGNTATSQVAITSPSAPDSPNENIPLTWEKQDGTWKLSDASGCLLLGYAQAPCTPA